MTIETILQLVDEFGRAMRDDAKNPGTVSPAVLNRQREELHEAIRALAVTGDAATVAPATREARRAIDKAAFSPAPVRSGLTTDPNDPRLTRGGDDSPVPQAAVYLVLSEDERRKGFVRPYRDAYIHDTCTNPSKPPNITITTMGRALAETYAREPKFYGATYCTHCRMHRPVSEFHWYEMDGSTGPVVGT